MERNIAHIALFTALVAVMGLIPALNLPFGVPITIQNLGIMLCGTVLGAKRGALSVVLFLVLVAIGLPLLSGGRGGLGVFAGPSVGFLIGFPVSAFVTGLIVERWKGSLAQAAFMGSLIGGIPVLYAFGIVGMAVKLDKTLIEAAILTLAFIPGDLIKCVLAGVVTRGIAKMRPDSLLSRS
ncbi:MAG: biotin transporter BioY [Rhodobacteraceae bacterium]|nr:biotin transporter BioY [Paracoccaceae bacterium]